jgi:glucokinase
MPRVILAGDVGGTKTRLALFSPDGTPRTPVFERDVASRDYPSLEALVLEFMAAASGKATFAAIGIAGPVVQNRVEATNLPWLIDGTVLGARLGAPCVLLNDLAATGWGIEHVAPTEIESLQVGVPSPGNRALIAAGTGLGEALLIWDGARHVPVASEGGHADLAARDPVEDEFVVWLRAKYGHVSYERVLSGHGLADIYRFLSDTGRGAEPGDFGARFRADADPARVVTAGALDGSCERAGLALERFVAIYGAEAGNLALKAFAVDGVYIGGGIAPRIAPALRRGAFARAFNDKGRLSPVLTKIPIRLILDDRAALWGAAAFAFATARSAPVTAGAGGSRRAS